MNEIIGMITSPAWWFATVLMAFLVNLMADYARSPLDTFLARINSSFRESSSKRKLRFENDILLLSQSPTELIRAEVVCSRSYANLIFSIIMLLFISAIMFVIVELRALPMLEFLSDGTVLFQSLAKNSLFYGTAAIILGLFNALFAINILLANRKISYLNDLLYEYNKRNKQKSLSIL